MPIRQIQFKEVPLKYIFTVKSNFNNNILATGCMTSDTVLNEDEQIDLFHNWSNGQYKNKDVNIFITLQT